MYNILVVDDSALMRKFMCDIINKIDGFHVADVCADGETAYLYMKQKQYSAVTLSMTMPTYDGISILKKLKEDSISIPVIAISSSIKEDRELAIRAMELGARDFVLRPLKVGSPDMESFSRNLCEILISAVTGKPRSTIKDELPKVTELVVSGKKKPLYDLIAIASSTGGPQALQILIPMMPKNLGVPVVIVQHMPNGFTASLAERLDHRSKLSVVEAKTGETLKPDTVYIAKGGNQLRIKEKPKGVFSADVTDEKPVNNLRPCADVMFESLANCSFKKILCVVLTGMGSDGAKGIAALKTKKRIHVITQDEKSSVVYGMPKAAYDKGLSNKVCDINEMASEIAKELGVL